MKEEGKNLFESFVFNPAKKDSGISFSGDYIIEPDKKNILSGLKKINIFVGANNSGKSRILRAIFKQKYIMYQSIFKAFIKYSSELKTIIKSSKYAEGQFVQTKRFLESTDNLGSKDFWILEGIPTQEQNYLDNFNKSYEEIKSYFVSNTAFFARNGEPLFQDKIMEFIDSNKTLSDTLNKLPTLYRIYIPVLRGMRTISDINSDPYGDRTKKDYFENIDDNFQKVSSGLNIYQDIKSKLLGSQKDRTFIRSYEEFLSLNFFNKRNITLVPREKDDLGNDNDVVHITFEDKKEQERAIYQYGDGIQSIICITYPIFSWLSIHKEEENNNLLVCIEEPEIYLHPSMQRNLVKVLMSEDFKNIQYFVTTHSNHFLDLFYDPIYQNDISVYGVYLDVDGIKKTIRKEIDLSSPIYELLGAQPSSLMLANKTVWIEGITDRLYIRHGIALYFEQDKNKEEKIPSEDLDYSFIEYGGANLAHYINDEDDLSIDSISNTKNVFMLVDSDNAKAGSKKYKRYQAIKEQIEKSSGVFRKTEGREIENYIKPDIIRKIYTNLPITIVHNNYLKESLPSFLIKKKCTVNLSKGKFSNKVIFAEKITEEQKSWDDLSKGMQKLVKEIILFTTNK